MDSTDPLERLRNVTPEEAKAIDQFTAEISGQIFGLVREKCKGRQPVVIGVTAIVQAAINTLMLTNPNKITYQDGIKGVRQILDGLERATNVPRVVI